MTLASGTVGGIIAEVMTGLYGSGAGTLGCAPFEETGRSRCEVGGELTLCVGGGVVGGIIMGT